VAQFVLGCVTCTVHMARRFNHFSNYQQCTKWYNTVVSNNYN